ncbi:hypothetical protein IH992_32660 [Candidatus Poribacteria bacterium]|nr:hypothetical protein [Candidatus Poribacteria bacterium]
MKPIFPGPQLVRVASPFLHGSFPAELGLTIHADEEEFILAVRVNRINSG